MRIALTIASLLPIAACVADFEDSSLVIDAPRVLAVRGIPAEARPGTPVRYETLVAGTDGLTSAEYSFCTKARGADERTGVSATCLAGEALVEVGENATIPSNACALFGPNTPPSEAGMPGLRPSDPDPSGGFYVPVLATADVGAEVRGFGFQRIRCDLAGATRDIFDEYQARYRENRHPIIVELTATSGDRVIELAPGASADALESATTLRIEVRADSFEDFVVYSANESRLFDRRETLRVNWYSTTGEFDSSEAFIDESTRSTTTDWTVLDSSRARQLWVVVRDSRGGMTWAEFRFETSRN